MIDYEEIKKRNPLEDYLHARGVELKRSGANTLAQCPLHEDRSPSFSVNLQEGVWFCHGGCGGGSVIDLHAQLNGMTVHDAARDLAGEDVEPAKSAPRPISAKPRANTALSEKPGPTEKPREMCAYDYQDETGRVVYQVVRYEPKTFRQRQVMPNGSHNWSMDGVERVLYRLPEVLSAEPNTCIFICEGEKDVETLRSVGIVATCNAGGAKKWLPAYTHALRNRRVYLVPDNDQPGQEHARLVLSSLEGQVEWARWMELPKEHAGKSIKDVSDLCAACDSKEQFLDLLHQLGNAARLIDRGVDAELYTMEEMEVRYQQEIARFSDVSLDLRHWMPSLNVRPLIPGDLLGILARTGNCKSASVQNIIANNPSLPTVFFQLEITESQMFERSAAIATGLDAEYIYEKYKRGERVDWKRSGKFKNLLVCPLSGLSIGKIDELIARSSAKFGRVPAVFVIDYIQLIGGRGSRYERVSDAAEQAKVLAKKWNCIGIIVTQASRKKGNQDEDDCDQEVSLQDGKESGSLENSCGVMLGVWKTGQTELMCKVLKNTKGGTAGGTAQMKLLGGSFIIEPK